MMVIFFVPKIRFSPRWPAFDKAVRAVYADFGFTEVAVKLALRPAKRVGDDAIWDKAEAALRGALKASGQTWEELPGEGAFLWP
jgi:threonyl-tRNA synthetase